VSLAKLQAHLIVHRACNKVTYLQANGIQEFLDFHEENSHIVYLHGQSEMFSEVRVGHVHEAHMNTSSQCGFCSLWVLPLLET
jgi:hypothetical protein